MARTREMLLGRIEKGGFFGEVNLFGIGKATASVIAMKKAVVACISYTDMKAFFAQHPAAAFKITSSILSKVCNRLYRADNRFLAAVFWTNVNP